MPERSIHLKLLMCRRAISLVYQSRENAAVHASAALSSAHAVMMPCCSRSWDCTQLGGVSWMLTQLSLSSACRFKNYGTLWGPVDAAGSGLRLADGSADGSVTW